MPLCSIKILSLLDSKSKFQMATLFSDHHVGVPRRYTDMAFWRFHTGLSKFLRNISPNILSFGKRTDLNLGEVSSFFICHNIAIS